MFRLSSLAFRTAWWSVSGHRVNQALYHKSCGQSFLSVSTQEYKKLFFFFPCHTVCALGDLDQGFERASVKCWLCPGLSWYALKYQFHSLADFFKLASKIHLYTSPAPFCAIPTLWCSDVHVQYIHLLQPVWIHLPAFGTRFLQSERDSLNLNFLCNPSWLIL